MVGPLFVKVKGPRGTTLVRKSDLSRSQLDELAKSPNRTLVRTNVDVQVATDPTCFVDVGVHAVDEEQMKWLRVGKIICSLKPEDFNSRDRRVGKVEVNGNKLLANVARFCAIVNRKLGDDARGTILSTLPKSITIISGVSQETARVRLNGEFERKRMANTVQEIEVHEVKVEVEDGTENKEDFSDRLAEKTPISPWKKPREK